LNGINFSDKGSIKVNYSGKSNEALVTVSDEGIGMSAEQINNLLSDDYIISSANTDKRKGNGLGYLIIKDLTAMMKADISIQSEPGKGTAVSLRFPVKGKKQTKDP
jgi:two-component system sensor histidine kinase EvgS